jgi:hypothetical protein
MQRRQMPAHSGATPIELLPRRRVYILFLRVIFDSGLRENTE